MAGKSRWVLGAALALSVTAGGALAQSAMAQAVKDRQAHFKQQGAAFKAVLDELKKDAPDKAVVAANAAKLKGIAAQLPTWFPKGSGPEAGVKTAAKPEVWTDQPNFLAAAQRLQGETAKLDELAGSGDIGAVKVQARAVGLACKNCHDRYRVPENS